MILTKDQSGGYAGAMTKATLSLFAVLAMGGCVQVNAPDKPIEINLNVNIRQEVVYSLKEDAKDLIQSNEGLFPQ